MKKYSNAIFWGIVTVLFSLVPFVYLQKAGSQIQLEFPLFSIHDDLHLILNFILGVVRGEFIPFLKNELPRMGAPIQALNFSEGFPLPEQLQLAVIKMLTLISNDPIKLLNIYFLSGYILAALAFFLSALSFGIFPSIAFGLSVAFTYLPFHHLRYEHLFLSHYWVLAPAAAIVMHSYKKEEPFSRREILLLAGSVFFVTLWHSYYGFFFTGVLCLGLLARGFRLKPRKFPPLVVILLLTFVSTIGISVAHHMVALHSSVDRPVIFKRNPSDVLLFGLRPWAVFLPVEGHRFSFFRNIRAQAMVDRGRIEGVTESIGTLGFLGVLLGVCDLIRRRWRRRKALAFEFEASFVQVLTFVFASRIGVAVLIAYAVSPVFRSTNRISPMLAASALFSLGLILSELIRNMSDIRKGRILVFVMGITLASIAIFDQVLVTENNDETQAEARSTRKFVAGIEDRIADGAVLQLPIASFPEQGSIYAMGDYAHSVGPLYSNNTRWSYGTWRETRAMAWIQDVARDPTDFPRMRKFGFSGIWIDRNGFADRGELLVAEIEKKNGKLSLSSDDGRRVFFMIPK